MIDRPYAELWAARRGDGPGAVGARERLIELYLPLGRGIAATVKTQFSVLAGYVEPEDLASTAMLGLIDAVDDFDEAIDVNFATFARSRIRGAVLDSLRQRDWLSRGARDRIQRVRAATDALHRRLGRRPTDDEVAGELGISVGHVRAALTDMEAGAVPVPVTPDTWDGHEHTAVDDGPEAQWVTDARRAIADALAGLPDRDRAVAALYYFAERPNDDARGLTMQEIADLLGMSRPWVNMVHNTAMLAVRELVRVPEEPDD